MPPNNPFISLFDFIDHEQKYEHYYPKKMAEELYGTFSRTIHQFQPSGGFGRYTPMPGHFDPMYINFLTAMTPKHFNEDKSLK